MAADTHLAPIPSAAAPPIGKRELNKAEKRLRIRAAARALFIENGFDGTTLQAVAERAKVGFGTIFDYASNKRDLLFMVYNPELWTALDKGCSAAARQTEFIDRPMSLFRSYYMLYRREPDLSRYFLRELTFYSDGAQARLFIEQRAAFLQRLMAFVVDAKAAAQLTSEAPVELMAQLMLSLFAWEVRRWLGTDPLDLEAGLERLRSLLTVQVQGFGPIASAPAAAPGLAGAHPV